MSEYKIEAKAKINLSLDIVGKRENGYHNLKMIMHTVNLCDFLTINETKEERITVKSNLSYLPKDDKNIIVKSYNAFYELTKIAPQGFDVYLKKNIPVCAGLGGGSSDSAAMLLFLNSYHNEPLSHSELLKLGESLGADVPFCITGGTCLAEGIGEILTPLDSLPPCHIVIAKPQNKGLSTKKIFSMVNIAELDFHPDTFGIIKALKEQDLNGVCKRMYNVLEEYSVRESGEITKFKEIFTESGAVGTLMSGSGNAVFGIYDDQKKAENGKERFKNLTNQVYLV